MGAWTSLIGSDVAAHIPPEQLILWGTPYIFIPRLADMTGRERDDWIALQPIHRSGDARLSPSEADAMLAAVMRLHYDNRNMRGLASALLESLHRIGIETTPQQQGHILAGLKAFFHDGCVVTPTFGDRDPNDNTAFLHRSPAKW